MVVYFYLFVIILLWTINPFIKKLLMTKFTGEEYFFINHLVVSIFVVFYFIYSYSNNNINSKCIKQIGTFSNKELSILFAGGLLTVLSSRLLPHLISLKKDISYLISNIQPVVIILTALIGYTFFQEKLNKEKILGIILVGMGLFFINSK